MINANFGLSLTIAFLAVATATDQMMSYYEKKSWEMRTNDLERRIKQLEAHHE